MFLEFFVALKKVEEQRRKPKKKKNSPRDISRFRNVTRTKARTNSIQNRDAKRLVLKL